MLSFTNKYGYNDHSQFREDGVIEEVFKRLGITSGKVGDIGAHNGYYCSNTRKWIDLGFSSVLVEANKELCDSIPKSEGSTIINAFAKAETINELLPPRLALLSIDTDGPCFGIWKAYNGVADVVIIEINSSKTPYVYTPVNDPNYGTAYLPMLVLGLSKGMFLLTHTANMIFVLNKYRELFPEIVGDGIANCEEYFNTDHLPR